MVKSIDKKGNILPGEKKREGFDWIFVVQAMIEVFQTLICNFRTRKSIKNDNNNKKPCNLKFNFVKRVKKLAETL